MKILVVRKNRIHSAQRFSLRMLHWNDGLKSSKIFEANACEQNIFRGLLPCLENRSDACSRSQGIDKFQIAVIP
jgi:hypothetical protein